MYTISEEQQKLLNDSFSNINIFITEFSKVMCEAFKEQIKPIIVSIKAFLKDKNDKFKIKIKYKPILKITANSYIGIHKPKMICCRNNC